MYGVKPYKKCAELRYSVDLNAVRKNHTTVGNNFAGLFFVFAASRTKCTNALCHNVVAHSSNSGDGQPKTCKRLGLSLKRIVDVCQRRK